MIDDNYFEWRPNFTIANIIIGIMSFQLLVLGLQKILGIKFFLPKFLRKQFYNYERMIKDNEGTDQLVLFLTNHRVIVLFV